MAGANAGNAKCLLNTAETQNFNTYITQCRTNTDTARANNLFTPSVSEFKDTFAGLRAQYDSLLLAGNNTSVMANLAGTSSASANEQINELSKKKDFLVSEIKALRARVEAADRGFMDSVMNVPDKKPFIPNLQDLTLLVFWFGWLFMIVTIVAVRWFSPGGGWKAGSFTMGLMLLVTMCVYALIVQIA
jgi:hypothetical protein